MSKERAEVNGLEQRIADLRARLPEHSTPPAMLIELEQLEEALERARSVTVRQDQ
jgi:hypothetical protein